MSRSTSSSSTIAIVAAAASCGLVLGSALTYLVFARTRNSQNESSTSSSKKRKPGLRGTPSSARAGSASKRSGTKRSAYALAQLASKRSLRFADQNGTGTGTRGLNLNMNNMDDENDDPTQNINISNHLPSEHVSFLSRIMDELWPYIDKAGSQMVKEMMEPLFADMLPGPLKTLKFTKLDLGDVPIQLDNVVVHPLPDDQKSVQFDLDVLWDGECNIQMRSDFGLTFGVRSVKLSGRMSFFLCPLTNVLPVIGAIQYAFINPPDLELDFTGLAQVADFTVIDKTIRKMIQDIMAGMMVLPQRMLYKMDLANDFLKTYQPPIGVAMVTIVRGRGFVIERGLITDDIPDVYFITKFGAEPTEWRTRTVWDDLNPIFQESAMFVLSDYDQAIALHAWDEDKSPLDPDDDLGEADICVGDLLVQGGIAEVELCEVKNDEPTGATVEIQCEVLPFTTESVASFDEEICRGPNGICGCVTILVTKALNIPLKPSKASTFVKVSFAGREYYTSVVTEYPGLDDLNPVYDAAFMVPLSADIVNSSTKIDGVMELALMNDVDTVLGKTTVRLSELAKAEGNRIQEARKIGRGGAAVEFQITLYGVDTSNIGKEDVSKLPVGSSIGTPVVMGTPVADNCDGMADISSAIVRNTPISTPVKQITVDKNGFSPRTGEMGRIRITACRGRGFKVNSNAGGIFVKMRVGKEQQDFITSTVSASAQPVWEESNLFALNDHEDELVIDVFCQNTTSASASHDHLGTASTSISELLIAAKQTDLPLKHKTGRRKETGSSIIIDCDMVSVELDSSFGASSLGMSSSSSVISIESGSGSLVFGTNEFRAYN